MSHAVSFSPDRGTAGFTLIEVLITLAVLAVSLGAIGSVMATTTRGVQSLERHVSLREAARTIASALPPRAQLTLGSLAGALYGERWRIDVSPFVGGGVPLVESSQWVPRMIHIQVQSPSGASLNFDAVRLQRRRTG